MIVRAKLCGIRCRQDLELAVQAGADAVGFISGITHVSEDVLTADGARDLVRITPPYVSTVLVTHLEEPGEILDLAAHAGVDTIQVHGLVSVATLAAVQAGARGARVVRAIHVEGTDAVERALEVTDHCDAVLLDSRTTDRLGGTGRTHDWSISRAVADALRGRGRPVVLAGGLHPENVADAIRAVEPFAVDVNSGVEDEHGDKDRERCRQFVSRSRDALTRAADPAA